MFGFFRKKSGSSQTLHIPIAELAPLWREPEEPEKTAEAEKRKIAKEPDPKQTITDNNKTEAVDLETLVAPATPDPALNNNDAWYDQKGLMGSLRSYLDGGKTQQAFVFDNRAYYSLDTLTGAVNHQRERHGLEPMEPGAVIEFFKTDRGLESGKYSMRFESGLPNKAYLYTHPVRFDLEVIQQLPLDETGRRLTSLKRIK